VNPKIIEEVKVNYKEGYFLCDICGTKHSLDDFPSNFPRIFCECDMKYILSHNKQVFKYKSEVEVTYNNELSLVLFSFPSHFDEETEFAIPLDPDEAIETGIILIKVAQNAIKEEFLEDFYSTLIKELKRKRK
jgi:hypothetical protein